MHEVLRVRTRSARGAGSQAGFTLIELLVVIIIIAILAAIAIPTYLGQRQQAQDAAAVVLLRNALTTVQTAFVDEPNYLNITVADLTSLEISVTWVAAGGNLVDTTPPGLNPATPASARDHEVAVFSQSPTQMDIATVSESGNIFGIQIDTLTIGETGYVKVKVIDGSASTGW